MVMSKFRSHHVITGPSNEVLHVVRLDPSVVE
jgi:hypothetical protein